MRKFLIFLLLGTVWADDLKRPTVDAQGSCVGFPVTSPGVPKAYDAAGATTSSFLGVSSGFALPHGLGFGSRTQNETRRLTTWTAAGNTYLALTLSIISSSVGATGTGGSACLSYSVNSGSSWTSIRCSSASWSMITDSVALSPTQDLTKLQVSACIQANGNDPDNISTEGIQLFDVWTLGTNTPQGAGNGSTAGQPHRGLLIAN